jgi:tight adherence protein B
MAALTAGPKAAIALLAAATAFLVYQRAQVRRSAQRHRASQLPPALEALAASIRTGASLPTALHEVGTACAPPLGPDLTAVARTAAHGRPVTEALDEWSARHDDAGTRLAATALVLATVVGSTPARAVDGVAATLRERLDLAAERRALGTQARASSLVLALAPAAFATLLILGDPPAAHFLLGTPAGWACLAIGITFDAAGAWWMTRLTKGTRP